MYSLECLCGQLPLLELFVLLDFVDFQHLTRTPVSTWLISLCACTVLLCLFGWRPSYQHEWQKHGHCWAWDYSFGLSCQLHEHEGGRWWDLSVREGIPGLCTFGRLIQIRFPVLVSSLLGCYQLRHLWRTIASCGGCNNRDRISGIPASPLVSGPLAIWEWIQRCTDALKTVHSTTSRWWASNGCLGFHMFMLVPRRTSGS